MYMYNCIYTCSYSICGNWDGSLMYNILNTCNYNTCIYTHEATKQQYGIAKAYTVKTGCIYTHHYTVLCCHDNL